jgi:hypothetical protein
MQKRDIALDVLKKFVGLPYRWGGNDPMTGFDCSGLMVEALQSVGLIGRKEDFTANQLANQYPETDILQPGVMVYWDWNKDGIIDHVEMIVSVDEDGEIYTIGASGGDSATTTESQASAQNAYIKVRPLMPGYKMANDPF